jgi:two-component system, chemotaxis family, chemotaxis protein CheY
VTSSTEEQISSLLSKVFLPRLRSELCEGRRVLVVDDEIITRGIAKALLQKFGFSEVEEATDGAAALELIRKQDFALVVSDYLMEPMSGVDLFRKMRADRRMREIPFVMLTASLSHDNVLAARRAGIKHYLLKPFRLETLHQKLIELLAPHELRRRA